MAAAVAAAQRSRSARSIPPTTAWTVPSTAPPTSPPMAAEPAASTSPTTSRAATPASGNPTKVATHRAHLVNLAPSILMAASVHAGRAARLARSSEVVVARR